MTTMLVPVGVAYAEASGVPGRNGEAVNAYLASHPVEWVDREQRESPKGQARLRSGRSRFPA